ncbi:hypothetical protein FOL47_010288 [Perkinsus chesapeaki]|uniref:Uncharacterized protein n=1 Tax=Perkinsus chesapeaki TaxID=330153 RepID=A0A7J6L3Q1_PERCH|nr:hypothetical protein FOL47_010288 [Perkinsus chesapeaki]
MRCRFTLALCESLSFAYDVLRYPSFMKPHAGGMYEKPIGECILVNQTDCTCDTQVLYENPDPKKERMVDGVCTEFCDSTSQCPKAPKGAQQCLKYGGGFHFCLIPCKEDTDCPELAYCSTVEKTHVCLYKPG